MLAALVLSLAASSAVCTVGSPTLGAPSARARSLAPVAPAAASATADASRDEALEKLWNGGEAFKDFLDRAKARRELWLKNYEVAPPDELVARAAAVGGTWRLLVVAVDGCSDSANSVPQIARLVEKVPGLELRVVSPTDGRAVMEAHRTPDGRAATPTIVLLDASFAEAGCWIERPAELQKLMTDAKAKSSDGDVFSTKMKWYEENRGRAALGEIVEMLEGAAAGTPRCASST